MILGVMRRKSVRAKTENYELHHGQLPILERIIEQPGLTQQEIAAWLMVTPASVAQSITRLEKAGLIERKVDPENRRRNHVFATENGMHAATLYRKSFDEVDMETFRGLSDEELTRFAALLDRMIDNMDDNETGECPRFPWKGESPR